MAVIPTSRYGQTILGSVARIREGWYSEAYLLLSLANGASPVPTLPTKHRPKLFKWRHFEPEIILQSSLRPLVFEVLSELPGLGRDEGRAWNSIRYMG